MKTFFLLFVSLLALRGTVCLAQAKSDSIQTRKVFGGTRFELNGKQLTARKLSLMTRSNPAAQAEMKKARTNHALGSLISVAGGFLIGYQLGGLIRGDQPNWLVAGAGVGLLGLSVPFGVGYNKHATRAVELYNAGLGAANTPGVNVRAGFAFNHIRLGVTF
ncbi:MAG: hypothetical protein AVDCRST_MAG56-2528 [uncultured Cytophagales bacterium]|uniref:Uncharacterized protein n=1 Tax=uncultured Cytophagales bacterium TaxID=158755 RepID=A0A6J4IUC3_9SPHI|nr:MAG: hypothetical protein AVDCRST_MAG56-2528 [uncultured Cytophagales bacterium]